MTTLYSELPWADSTAATRLVLPMSCTDELCIHFKTPAQLAPNPGYIALTEYDSQRCQRSGCISWGQGDFAGSPGTNNVAYGTTISWSITVSTEEDPWICALMPDHDFYINVRNTTYDGTIACVPGQDCQMVLNIRIPRA